MKKLKLAIIGQGRSGKLIHGAYYKSATNEYFDVAYVVDADEKRRQTALNDYKGCEVLSDYKELFDKKVDLVVNASYSYMHYSITKDLLEHKFNVLVEKPFARNVYECEDLINTAKNNGVVLAVFQQTFLAPFYQFAKELALSGKLGKIEQVSIRYNGLARRWDWQTLQKKMGGSVYNTGPHPIGMAMGFLDFDKNLQVVYSKLATALTSGDAEDYAKIILTAPSKPVIDVEISAIDAYSDYNLKIQGNKGTFKCTTQKYEMKYLVDGENPPRPYVEEFLHDENNEPIYCSEKLNLHEESGSFEGDAFGVAVERFYKMLYETITSGKPLEILPENIARLIGVIEKVHADNPLPLKY